jgi:hypothetical protein
MAQKLISRLRDFFARGHIPLTVLLPKRSWNRAGRGCSVMEAERLRRLLVRLAFCSRK